MGGIQKLRVYTGSHNQVQKVRLLGDKTKQLEPHTVIIQFPWGELYITRRNDSESPENTEYWCHFSIAKDSMGNPIGKLQTARIDCRNLSTSEADVGDFAREDVEHVAILIGQDPDLSQRDYEIIPMNGSFAHLG